MKLIDKEAVLAEIKKLNPPFYPTLAEKMSYQDATKDCIDIIYTLGVKEVDFEKELIEWHKEHFKKDGTFIGMSGFYLTNSSQMELAKRFFELGLKAQKGEYLWKK